MMKKKVLQLYNQLSISSPWLFKDLLCACAEALRNGRKSSHERRQSGNQNLIQVKMKGIELHDSIACPQSSLSAQLFLFPSLQQIDSLSFSLSQSLLKSLVTSSSFAKCSIHASKAHAQAMCHVSCGFGAPRVCSSPVLEREYDFGYDLWREKTFLDQNF